MMYRTAGVWITSLVLFATGAVAQTVAKVERIVGHATVQVAHGTPQSLQVGQELSVGASIHTAATSEVHVMTHDGGYLAVRPNSHLVLQQYSTTPDATATIELGLFRGALRSITGWIGKLNPAGYKVNTPTATIGIRGTDHEVSVLEKADGESQPGTYDSVREGATIMRNRDGKTLDLEAGQDGFVSMQDGSEPRRLAQRPAFLLQRLLQIEDRIEERRAAMVERFETFVREHPEQARKLRERWDKMSPDQRDKAREALRNQIQRRRQPQ